MQGLRWLLLLHAHLRHRQKHAKARLTSEVAAAANAAVTCVRGVIRNMRYGAIKGAR